MSSNPIRRGVLLDSPQSRFGPRVFFCNDGLRHWITDGAWLAQNGFKWPDDVIHVPGEVIESFKLARPAPMEWPGEALSDPRSQTPFALREILVSKLHGRGIEIGAGSSPMPIPLHCSVSYVDVFDHEQLIEHAYAGQERNDIVAPDIVGSFENLSAIPDGSLDFIVACHVIEHTRDPIGAIAEAYKKLRTGGTIALVIPDMKRTFDRNRRLTDLSHLIDDFRAPHAHRDAEHFEEFYRLGVTPKAELESMHGEGHPLPDFEEHWKRRWREAYPIHYHTWTYESFSGMVDWIQAQVCPFESVWKHPAIDGHRDSIEFYFSMTK